MKWAWVTHIVLVAAFMGYSAGTCIWVYHTSGNVGLLILGSMLAIVGTVIAIIMVDL